jgi:putative ABC transport system ATP-binding protein
MSVIIRTQNLSKEYLLGSVRVPALHGVSLSIRKGEMVCINGRSGSGKSTLLRQLSLIDTPTKGVVILNGEEASHLGEKARARLRLERLGYVFQEYALVYELTAQENVALPGIMLQKETPVEASMERAAQLLQAIGLGDRLMHMPSELSGGQQQRVAIARALINKPDIIFADEPTANLDTISAKVVMETLAELNKKDGVTVLFVSHDPEDTMYANRTIMLKDGKIEKDGKR